MKKSFYILILALCIVLLASCSLLSSKNTYSKASDQVVFIDKPYVFLDSDFVLNGYAALSDHWDTGKCSACVKKLSNGDVIVGRNMDLVASTKPAYVVKTAVPGKNKTIGLTYNFLFGPDYKTFDGLDKETSKVLPFYSTDVMNEKGLYVELNMRAAEYDKNGKSLFSSDGTNPYAEKRIPALLLPFFIGQNCSTVEDVLDYVSTINVYTDSPDTEFPYSYCYILADADGNYGLLELAKNRFYWIEGQDIQTNFYITEGLNKMETKKVGLGRYAFIRSRLDSVKSEEDMHNLMADVTYKQCYDIDNCNYDCFSEFVTDKPEWTNKYFDTHKAEIEEYIRGINSRMTQLDKDEFEQKTQYWITIFSVVANPKARTLNVQFFEDPDQRVTIGGYDWNF